MSIGVCALFAFAAWVGYLIAKAWTLQHEQNERDMVSRRNAFSIE